MPPQTQRRRRMNGAHEDEPAGRRRSSRRDEYSEEDEDEDEKDEDGNVSMTQSGISEEQQQVKKLVRYAVACEHAGIPIKRDGIREKVLGNSARSFKGVFNGAQKQLRDVFGMEMTELPIKEKRALKEKQKAIASKRNTTSSATSRSYILTSVLPKAYKIPQIVGPSKRPSHREESEFVAFYTFAIAAIVLAGGELSDSKLKQILGRMNANDNLPFGKTADALAKLVRLSYLDRIVEKNEGNEDDTITWAVGSRGRVEVPPDSIAAVIRVVYGEEAADEEFERRLNKSLGFQNVRQLQAEGDMVDADE